MLGNGYQLIEAGGRTLVASVPIELNTDQQHVIDAAQATSCVSIQNLITAQGWTEVRIQIMLVVESHDSVNDTFAFFGNETRNDVCVSSSRC